MPPELQRITKEALSLPEASRAQLVHCLLESLEQPENGAIEQSWIEEADERCRQIDAGEVELLDGVEVLHELRASFR